VVDDPLDEVGVRAAASAPGIVVGQPASVATGAAESVGRDRRLQGEAERGVVERVLHDDAGAHRPADEVSGADAECLECRAHVVAEVADPPGGVDRRVLGAPEAAQVDGEDPQVRGQVLHQLLPEQRRRDVPMDQHHRAVGGSVGRVAVALENVDVQPGRLDDAFGDSVQEGHIRGLPQSTPEAPSPPMPR
jgi:hypothetical protein